MNLTSQWQFLAKEPGPKMLVEALKTYGTKEFIGKENNPVIMDWVKFIKKDTGERLGYKADSIPWCGLAVGYWACKADKVPPLSILWARGWLEYGKKAEIPMLGDVMVFKRGSGGHVGLYVGENKLSYFILGGNQNDSVSIKPCAKNRFLGARRSYKVIPPNVRKILVDGDGRIDTGSEA